MSEWNISNAEKFRFWENFDEFPCKMEINELFSNFLNYDSIRQIKFSISSDIASTSNGCLNKDWRFQFKVPRTSPKAEIDRNFFSRFIEGFTTRRGGCGVIRKPQEYCGGREKLILAFPLGIPYPFESAILPHSMETFMININSTHTYNMNMTSTIF